MFLMPMRGGAKKTDLFSIAPTPFAQQKMHANPDVLAERQRMIQRLGL